MRILGLDEAGRGCVLGDLVVGAFCCDESERDLVVATGATDSKKLSRKKRESIREKLLQIGENRLISITPAEIDAGNLNRLEEAAFIDHIIHFNPDLVIIDAPAHPKAIPAIVSRMKAEVTIALGRCPEFKVEPKADLTYPICGAASIFAKVDRDQKIDALGPVGSGYPSDPKTRAWLTGFFEREEPLPDCVRKRWGSIRKLRQKSLL